MPEIRVCGKGNDTPRPEASSRDRVRDFDLFRACTGSCTVAQGPETAGTRVGGIWPSIDQNATYRYSPRVLGKVCNLIPANKHAGQRAEQWQIKMDRPCSPFTIGIWPRRKGCDSAGQEPSMTTTCHMIADGRDLPLTTAQEGTCSSQGRGHDCVTHLRAVTLLVSPVPTSTTLPYQTRMHLPRVLPGPGRRLYGGRVRHVIFVV